MLSGSRAPIFCIYYYNWIECRLVSLTETSLAFQFWFLGLGSSEFAPFFLGTLDFSVFSEADFYPFFSLTVVE